MMKKEKKIRYPRLGYVTPSQLQKHKDSMQNTHKYDFVGTYGKSGRTTLGSYNYVETYECRICGHEKMVDGNGNRIYE